MVGLCGDCKICVGPHPILNGDAEWKGNNMYWVCAGTAKFFWDRILEANCCSQGLLWNLQVMPARPRRNRRSPHLRAAFQETLVSPANFILPLFVHEGTFVFTW